MFICLMMEGFFSGSEIAVISADQMKLRHIAANGSRGAKLALKMLKKPEWLLATTLVGTNIMVVTNTTLATALAINFLGESYSWVALICIAPMIWIFGEVVPKSVFQQRADAFTPYIIFLLWFFSVLFSPALFVFTLVTRIFGKISQNKRYNPFSLREEIRTMLQMPAQGDIQHTGKDMIKRVFTFSETSAQNVMTPLIYVKAVERGITCGEALRFADENAHIRLPVFEERIDRVVGVLNVLELLVVDPEEPIEPYIRKIRYVPGGVSVRDLLLDLRQDGDTLAIVVDEYGGAEGLVTVEDIMEEVVEEMEDEYDEDEISRQWVKKISESDYIVSARIEIENFEAELDIKIPRGKYETLAGYLLEVAREIPEVGTTVEVDGVKYTIKKGTPQTIQEVRVHW